MKKPKIIHADAVVCVRYFTNKCPCCGEITEAANPMYTECQSRLEELGYTYCTGEHGPIRPGEYAPTDNKVAGVTTHLSVEWIPPFLRKGSRK